MKLILMDVTLMYLMQKGKLEQFSKEFPKSEAKNGYSILK